MNYFDFHADTLTEITDIDETLNKNKRNLDLERVMSFTERYAQVFAIWKDISKYGTLPVEPEFKRLYEQALSLLAEQTERVTLCRSYDDMEEAFQRGKAAAFLSIEDISIMGKEVDRIKELGFCFAILVWNYQNQYACGASFDQRIGLTTEGKELCNKLIQQKIIIDVSHLSDQGVEDLCLLTNQPFVASHSNVRDVCNHARNLSRAHIKELIRREGYMGINFFRPFISTNGEAELTDVLKHIDYVLNLGGENILGIGSDFDGNSGLLPNSIEGVQSIVTLKQAMHDAGFGEVVINKILYHNGYQFIKKNL